MTNIQVFFEQSPASWLITAGLLGLVIGSFLNVVIFRLPVLLERNWRRECQELGESPAVKTDTDETINLITPRSRCQHCGHHLSALENIPVFSFLWLQGKCSACGQPISWRYPAVELLSAGVTISIAWNFGVSMAAVAAMLLVWTLIALAFIDFDHQLLPDTMTLPLLWGGLIVNIFNGFTTLQSAVIGAVAGYLSLWCVYQLFKLITGKEGMGYGDFKLFAALGAWLGWMNLPLMILLASAVGAIVGIANIIIMGRDRSLPIPFGPFLCLGGWVALLWGDAITRYYLQFARFHG